MIKPENKFLKIRNKATDLSFKTCLPAGLVSDISVSCVLDVSKQYSIGNSE
jgi:hypothetical protein